MKNLVRTKFRYCSIVSEAVVICQLTLKMPEEIHFENGRISNFKGLMTLTLDRVIRYMVVFHLSTSTYIPNFIRIGKTFCGWTDGRTSETHCIRSTLWSRPKNASHAPGTTNEPETCAAWFDINSESERRQQSLSWPWQRLQYKPGEELEDLLESSESWLPVIANDTQLFSQNTQEQSLNQLHPYISIFTQWKSVLK